MVHLAWNWLCVPYLVCAVSLAAVALVGALVRGDRVLRLGTVGAATSALPWAVCSALSACASDPALSTRLLRLGSGPIALVGPSLLLVLLGVSGQLERHRWIARLAAVVGSALLAVCWGTDAVVPGVHRLPSGIYYIDAGPLTGLHFSQIGVWLAVGMTIARRSTSGGERRGLVRMLIAVLALGAVGASDLLLVYSIAGVYPIAWLCATIAAWVAVYYELRSNLLRPQGLDRDVATELIGAAIAIAGIGAGLFVLEVEITVALAIGGSLAWVAALGVAWATSSARPVPVARARALEQFVESLADVESETRIAERLAALWSLLAIELRALGRLDGDRLIDVATGAHRDLDPALVQWWVEHGEPLAALDLGTMRLGAIRPALEKLVARDTALLVPLVDRGALVGLVEADHRDALREDERGLVAGSARAAARALTYARLAQTAARERETAREVEVAEAMRAQASASRDDELGPWTVHAEYRSAPRTTTAGWSTSLLPDGRLAVLVTEARTHGVAAALATAALTGAFVATTASAGQIGLDDLLAGLRASPAGIEHGGESVAAFVAILDPRTHAIAWACAGHPGAAVVGPAAIARELARGSSGGPRPRATLLGPPAPSGGGAAGSIGASPGGARDPSELARGEASLHPEDLLVLASSAVRGDPARWQLVLAEQVHVGSRMASALVADAARHGDASGVPREDLLAVVVARRRAHG